MRRILTALVVSAACSTIGFAADQRILTDSIAATKIDEVNIEAGVGRLEIMTHTDDDISIEIVLKPRRGGFFSSMKRAQEEVEAAEITSDIVGGKLYLEVSSESGDRRFEERWSVSIPAHIAIEAELGVGDVSVIGIEGGVELDVGVGEVEVEVPAGNVIIDLGVGDVEVSGPADAFGSAEVSGGVGGAEISVRGDKVADTGFIGHRASWTGDGEYEIEVEVGVGDASIKLE